jgi:hypothetical protein
MTIENGVSERRSLQDAVESLCARTGASPDTNANYDSDSRSNSFGNE